MRASEAAMQMTISEAIEKALSKHDVHLEGNDRKVHVVRGLSWWTVNMDNGKEWPHKTVHVFTRDRLSAAMRIARKFIDTGVVPKYGRDYSMGWNEKKQCMY